MFTVAKLLTLDETALFYMQARGILKKRSQSFDVCVLELSITSKYLN
jgi:hypothetical protein